jgi:hypothetical protein
MLNQQGVSGLRSPCASLVCSLDPDTPWSNVEVMIEAWKEFREIK